MTEKLKDRISTDKFFITDVFFCFFIALSGTGHFFNEYFQIANIIVPADIGLALFVGAWVLTRNVKIERRHWYLIACFVMMLAIALADRHGIGHILRDIKVFAYFFVPYFYVWQRKDDYNFAQKAMKTVYLMLWFTVVVCVVQFFTYGLRTLHKGFLWRMNGLGLTQYILAVAVPVFLAMGQPLKDKIGKHIYNALIVLFVLLVIAYWTRSVWLLLPMALGLYYFINFVKGEYKNLTMKQIAARLFLFAAACIVLLIIGYFFLKLVYPELAYLFYDRVLSFARLGTGAGDDTFTLRMNDIIKYFPKIFNSRAIIGWGFGDMLPGDPSTILENSFVYYVWKYGFVWCAVLLYKVFDKFRTMWKRNNKTNNAMIAAFIGFIFMGGISGHLNKYYAEPFMAMFLLMDAERYIRAKSAQDY